MKKRIILIEVLLLILMFSFPISGFASSNKNSCYLIQKSMFSNIWRYFVEYGKKGEKIFPPGEEFNKLAKDMLDKGVIKYPYPNRFGNCSYGVEVDSSGRVKMYCVYHGDWDNAEKYERMTKKRINNSLPFGFWVMLGLVMVSFCISFIKIFFRSIKKKVTEENKTKQIDYNK